MTRFADTDITRTPTAELRRSRLAVAVLFVLSGAVMGGWAGRIPSVRGQLGVSDGEWGLIVLGGPIGVLLSLLVLARVITRTGSRLPSIVGAAGMLVLTPVAALSTSPAALIGCLVVLGLAQGLLFGPMNALAVEVERGYGRSILSSFHFWYSGGQFLGGLLGVLAGVLQLSPALQLAGSSLLLAALYLATLRFLPDTQRTVADAPELHEPLATLPDPEPPARGWTPQIVLLAAIGFLSSINEGGSVQWSAMYTVSLGGGIAMGSVSLVCYSLAIATIRLIGDRIIEAVGRRRFLQLSATISAVGMGIGLLIGTIPAALVGFACVGIGSGCIVPVIMTLAGNQPEVPSAKAVALISLGEWPAFLLGPPVIGGLAELFGLRGGLSVIVLGALLILLLVTFVRERDAAPSR
ncbi:MAG: MFS transporter [Micropruina sp.]|uniref:MFS transporter n=1 Tax=Micropruina sp. TaxID=2737536 RepID=UPI0039E2FE14